MRAPGSFASVVSEVAKGATAGAAARTLGLPASLTEAIVEEAVRLGVLSRYQSGCSGCPGIGAGCDGCPLTRVAPEA